MGALEAESILSPTAASGAASTMGGLRSPMQSWQNRVDSVLMRPRRQTSSPGDACHVTARWSRPGTFRPTKSPVHRNVLGHKSPFLDRLRRKDRKAGFDASKSGYDELMTNSLRHCRTQQGRLNASRTANQSRIQDMITNVRSWGPPIDPQSVAE